MDGSTDLSLMLPATDDWMERYRLHGPAQFNRVAYSAAHVVADPTMNGNPWLDCAVDWDATIAYRRHLWSLGLGVAEAMDTAQRGMGMDWKASFELIRRSVAAAKDIPGGIVPAGGWCGVIAEAGSGGSADENAAGNARNFLNTSSACSP